MELRQLMTSALDRWFEAVLAEHKKLRDTENENTRVLNAKGELPENLAAEYEIKRKVTLPYSFPLLRSDVRLDAGIRSSVQHDRELCRIFGQDNAIPSGRQDGTYCRWRRPGQ